MCARWWDMAAPADAAPPPVIANAVSDSAAPELSHSLRRIVIPFPHPHLGQIFGPIRSWIGKGPLAPALKGLTCPNAITFRPDWNHPGGVAIRRNHRA